MDWATLSFESLASEDSERMALAEKTYQSSAGICCVDRGDEFDMFLRAWNASAWVALNATGTMVRAICGWVLTC